MLVDAVATNKSRLLHVVCFRDNDPEITGANFINVCMQNISADAVIRLTRISVVLASHLNRGPTAVTKVNTSNQATTTILLSHNMTLNNIYSWWSVVKTRKCCRLYCTVYVRSVCFLVELMTHSQLHRLYRMIMTHEFKWCGTKRWQPTIAVSLKDLRKPVRIEPGPSRMGTRNAKYSAPTFG